MNNDTVEFLLEKIAKLEQRINCLQENNTIVVKRKKLSDDCIYPTQNTPTDAGFDLFATEDVELNFGEPVKVSTGLALQLPDGYYASIRDRSGLGSKGIHVLGGVCDSGYTGEYKVILVRLNAETYELYFDEYYDDYDRAVFSVKDVRDTKPYTIKKGDKIAQVIFNKLPDVVWSDEEFSKTDREDKGFGSSGR